MSIVIGPIEIESNPGGNGFFNFFGPNDVDLLATNIISLTGGASFVGLSGIFPTTGKLSVFGDTPGTGSGADHAAGYQSSDSGATWARQDGASAPIANYSYSGSSSLYNGKVYVACQTNTFEITVTPFNLSTGLWEAALPLCDLIAIGVPATPSSFKLVMRSDGTPVLFVTTIFTGGHVTDCLWTELVAGVWQNLVTVLHGTTSGTDKGFILRCAFLGDSDEAHCFFCSQQGSALNGLYYGSVLAGGGTASQQVFTEGAYPNSWGSIGQGTVWNSTICLPYGDGTGMRILYGSPEGGSPTFTNELISTTAPFNFVTGLSALTEIFAYGSSILVSDGTKLHAVWLTGAVGPTTDFNNSIQYNSRLDSGTWGTDDLVLASSVLNTGGADDYFIHNITAAVVSADILGISFDQTGSHTMYYLSWQFSTTPPPIPLAAACPINGGTAQVGVPYTAQLQASGGTPPYTWVQTG